MSTLPPIQTQGYVTPAATTAGVAPMQRDATVVPAEQQLNLPGMPPPPPGMQYATATQAPEIPQTGDANTPPDARVQAAFDRPIPTAEPAQPAQPAEKKTFMQTLGEEAWKKALMRTQQESILGFAVSAMDDTDMRIALGYLIDVVWQQDDAIQEMAQLVTLRDQQLAETDRALNAVVSSQQSGTQG